MVQVGQHNKCRDYTDVCPDTRVTLSSSGSFGDVSIGSSGVDSEVWS